jgi:hypothetical protein
MVSVAISNVRTAFALAHAVFDPELCGKTGADGIQSVLEARSLAGARPSRCRRRCHSVSTAGIRGTIFRVVRVSQPGRSELRWGALADV